MRPVDKGSAPQVYTNYQDARNDLANKIDWCCSYCEMKVMNSINIDHVIPLSKGGAKLDWDNFLLACFHCNGKSNKSDKNSSRTDYYWPDIDNTINAFQYHPTPDIIEPKSSLSYKQKIKAQNTIDLLGLDKFPGKPNKEPTPGDKRWIAIQSAWLKANKSMDNWKKQQSDEMLEMIVECAHSDGHFSIWYELFKSYDRVRKALIAKFEGTYQPSTFDNRGKPSPRPHSDL
ncbi:MAG: HNH endonuclease signature motif containing protein [Candidatus Electrothrix scaldis]|nr:MAG: HNH endonuclease signature motif containing protein [Candidatus Electrothrix sp. GW3-3]